LEGWKNWNKKVKKRSIRRKKLRDFKILEIGKISNFVFLEYINFKILEIE